MMFTATTCYFVIIIVLSFTTLAASGSSNTVNNVNQTDTNITTNQNNDGNLENTKTKNNDDDDNDNLQRKEQCTKRLPHILFIVIDDLGSNDLGIHHSSGILTPVADHLANSGIYLSNYYVLPYCSPTRAALLTGRYPLHTGLHAIIGDVDTVGLPVDEELLPTVLRRVGYEAHAVGKWHIGHSKWEYTPTYRGFQSFYGYYLGRGDYYTHYNEQKNYANRTGYDMRHDKKEYCGPDCSALVDERGNYSTHIYTRESIRIIEDHAANHNDKPLFLYLAHQAVHDPDEVPELYYNLYKDKTDWSEMKKTYAGMLSAADESIGNVTRALQKAGMWDNTLVVFTTDNGGPTAVCSIQGSSNGIKRGGKCSVWEGGTTGDAFVSGPALQQILGDDDGSRNLDDSNTIPETTTMEEPQQLMRYLKSPYLFHAVDWLPTLASITGAQPAGKPLDGVNQVDAWKQVYDDGNNSTPYLFIPPRQELFVGYATYHGKWYGPAIRYENWKLLQGTSGGPQTPEDDPIGPRDPATGGNSNDTYLLFDLLVDPEEANDVSAEYPIVVQILQAKLREYQKSYVPPITHDTSCDAFSPIINTTTFGPVYMPWCSKVVVYS